LCDWGRERKTEVYLRRKLNPKKNRNTSLAAMEGNGKGSEGRWMDGWTEMMGAFKHALDDL
jgi:hypothetical protein